MHLQAAMPNAQPQFYQLAASSPTNSYTSPALQDAPTHGLWSSLAHRPSSHISTVRSFDSFRSFHGDLPARSSDSGALAASPAASASSSSSSSSSSAICVAGHRHHRHQAHDRAYMRHQSAPVDVVPPCQWRSYREERRNVQRRRRDGEAMASREEEEDEEEEEEEEEEEKGEEEEEEKRLPPHEELARERAAATSCGGDAFSLCQGAGRTLKGRDLCRVRNAILKQTGFIS